jgi:uncharacterized protein YcbK (DUF882 family)
MNVTENFSVEEFRCKDGCGLYNMKPELLGRLQQARTLAGIPFAIASGSRCAVHNRAVGGKTNSAHLSGLAVDIVAIQSRTRFIVFRALTLAGFERIGVGHDFIHADVDLLKPYPAIWLY